MNSIQRLIVAPGMALACAPAAFAAQAGGTALGFHAPASSSSTAAAGGPITQAGDGGSRQRPARACGNEVASSGHSHSTASRTNWISTNGITPT